MWQQTAATILPQWGDKARPMSENDAKREVLGRLLSEGGDARIRIDPVTRRNQYMSSPWPVQTTVYASSTANDISTDAFAHCLGRLSTLAPAGRFGAAGYAEALDALRVRILAAYAVGQPAKVVFAASGTDLEYLGLAMIAGRAGVRNILLGADEVGSGCVYSASGLYFAQETARGLAVTKGAAVDPALAEATELFNVPVRDDAGRAYSADEIADAIDAAVRDARSDGRAALVHVVHGSKTGLVVPHFEHIDELKKRHGGDVGFIVDACQARITSAAIGEYLSRGCVVMLTGSKFMGGPPFSGFALVPESVAAAAGPLPAGFETVFRRAEWPDGWAGRERLPEEANLGLLLRLEASVFELERFQAIPIERVERVVLAFHAAVRAAFVERLGGRRIAPYAPGERQEGDAHPVEMRTLSTIDLTPVAGLSRSQASAAGLPGAPDFDQAVALHKALVERGVRLGQPVKCVRLPDGRWGATLRVGLSMPQVTAFDRLDDTALAERLAGDMGRIVEAVQTVQAEAV